MMKAADWYNDNDSISLLPVIADFEQNYFDNKSSINKSGVFIRGTVDA